MNVIGITIGNRDIKIEDKYIYNIKKDDNIFPEDFEDLSPRKTGKYILDNYKKFKDNITLPIINPFLEAIRRKNIKVSRIILFATDQPESIESKWRNKDTIYFAQFIKYKLKGMKICSDEDIKIIKIGNEVNYLDSVYKQFTKEFKNNPALNDLGEDTNFFILPVGGIPAIISALLFNSILYFRNNVKHYNVDENGNVIPISFNNIFLKELEKNSLLDSLKNFFYASIRDKTSNEYIRTLADYAYNRLTFNFDRAYDVLEKISSEPNNRYKVSELRKSIDELYKDKNKRLIEIFHTAIIKIKQEQYVDALLRLYNFTDNFMSDKVFELLNLNKEKKAYEDYWKFEICKTFKKDEKFEKFIINYNETPNFDYKKQGLPTYMAILKYFHNENKIDEKFIKVCKCLIKISDLRNKSIGAHGFQGISKEKINDILKSEKTNIDDLLKEIEQFLNAPFQESVYFKIKEYILKEMNEYSSKKISN